MKVTRNIDTGDEKQTIRTISTKPKEHFEGRWKSGRLYPLYSVVVNNGTTFISQNAKMKEEPYVIYDADKKEFKAPDGWLIKEMSADSRVTALGGGGEGGVTPDEVEEMIKDKVDKVDGKGLSTNDYDNTEKNKVASAYQKPNNGIPKSDLAKAVQDVLDGADGAYKKPVTGIPFADLADGVQDSLSNADEAVKAEPVGPIIAPPETDEFATKTQLSGLDAEIKNLGLPAKGSVSIKQVSGGIITYTPKHWINEYTNCVCEFVFKYPDSAVSATQFILTIVGTNGNDYIYFASGGINANIGGTLVTLTPPISAWGGQHTLRMVKEGSTITFYLDGVYCNLATLTPRDAQTIYIGGYPGAPAANALISFYSLTVWNESEAVVEKHTATDSFSQMTGTMVSTANFVDYYEKNVVFSGAYYLNETITIANRNLYGNGCLILCGPNAKIIINDGASVQGFQFVGEWNPTRTRISGTGYYAYVPIMTDSDIEDVDDYTADFFIVLRGTNSAVLNCVVRNFDKTAIMCDSQGAYTNSTQVNINGNELYFNRCGIGYKTEFATIGANRINACLVGIYAKGGNLSFVNNKLLMCDCAIVVGNTGNGGHSEFTGNEIAHCGKYGIYCPELGRTLGNIFVGGQIFDAPIKLINTSGFMFVGCRLATWYELTMDNWPQGIDSNAVHSCYITGAYAQRDEKPLFYYPDGGLSLKLNTHPYDVADADVNN